MKKSLSIVLLAVLIYNSVGFIFNFEVLRNHLHQKVKVSLSNRLNDEELVKFVFKKSEFSKSVREFELQGKYYDVVKIEEQSDFLLVYCYKDDKETHLILSFSKFLSKTLDLDIDLQRSPLSTRKFSLSDFVFVRSDFNLRGTQLNENISKKFPLDNTSYLSLYSLEVTTPPPQSSQVSHICPYKINS